MNKKILITGVSGFIGRHVVRKLVSPEYSVSAIIRPGTDSTRISEFESKVNFIEIDLTDLERLEKYLSENRFDCILHIGALRGGRNCSREEFYAANVSATGKLMANALENASRFIFCSSVGVFGAIPSEVPARETTPRNADNIYHYTKIKAEEIFQEYVSRGLNGVILRPSITYGAGDYGFPYTLVRLVDKSLMCVPGGSLKIHLTNVDMLSEAFVKLLNGQIDTGSAYIIADKEPVDMLDLLDFISVNLRGKPYSRSRLLNKRIFNWAEKLAKTAKSEVWICRIELISKSWYYDVEKSFKELLLPEAHTIPDFKVVVDWYRELD